MNNTDYRAKFNELKEQQRPILDKYNRSKSKANKRALYNELMEFEDKLFNL